MMSGPAPVLAATAAFGRTSSQPSLSTRTSMPVFSVNLATFFVYWSMSPCTKRLQRSTRSFAPFSGLNAMVCACADVANSALPAPIAAATPAEPSRNLRRLNSLIVCLLDAVVCRPVEEIVVRRRAHSSGGEALPGSCVEQVRALDVGLQVDRRAGGEVMALAEHGGQLDAVVPAGDERVHAGRLEHDHLRRDAARVDQQ